MDSEIYLLTIDLKKRLHKLRCFKLMNKYEKKMKNDKEVIKLTKIKDDINLKYNQIINREGEDSEIAQETLMALSNAKKELYENKIVKKYLKNYLLYQKYLNRFNYALSEKLKYNFKPK